MKKIFFSLFLMTSMTLAASASEVRYSNEPTISPIRIFFVIFIIILFIASEFAFDYFRKKRIESRPERYEKKMKELEEKRKAKEK